MNLKSLLCMISVNCINIVACGNYWFGIQLVLIDQAILVRMRSVTDSLKVSNTISIIKKQLQEFRKDDIIMGEKEIIISLQCPLTLTRIRTPARSKNCKHAQCFDLDSFLSLSRNPDDLWQIRCVYCNEYITYDSVSRLFCNSRRYS
jgi:hypothetical protein